MVVSEVRWSFLGSFLEESKITDEKIPGCNVQSLDLLKDDHRHLLLLTGKYSVDILIGMDRKNVEIFDLVDCYIY
jgi:hypothetical protein